MTDEINKNERSLNPGRKKGKIDPELFQKQKKLAMSDINYEFEREINSDGKFECLESKNKLIYQQIKFSPIREDLDRCVIKNPMGYFFTEVIEKVDKDDNPTYKERIKFMVKDIKKSVYNMYNPNINRNDTVDKTLFIFDSKKMETYLQPNDVYPIMRIAKRNKGQDEPVEYGEFVVNFINEIKPVAVKGTLISAFVKGKYYDTNHGYEIYRKEIEKYEDKEIESFVKTKQDENYSEFLELEPDENIVDEVVELINRQPRNEEEAKKHLIVYSWAYAGVLKYELKRLGIKISPFLFIIGPNSSGKSTLLNQANCYQFNTQYDYNNNSLKGRGIIRFQNRASTFPIHVDDCHDFPNEKIGLFKSGITSGLIVDPKGKPDGGMYHLLLANPIAISSNNFIINDEALYTRMIIMAYKNKEQFKLNSQENETLSNNIIHLGKHFYNRLPEFDIETVKSELEKEFEPKIKNVRERQKFLVLKIGEYVCKQLGLFKDTTFTYEDICEYSNSDDMRKFDTILRDTIMEFLDSIKIGTSAMSIKNILSGLKPSIDFLQECANRGIYFSPKLNTVYLSQHSLAYINKNLERNGMIDRVNNTNELITKGKVIFPKTKSRSCINRWYVIQPVKKFSDYENSKNFSVDDYPTKEMRCVPVAYTEEKLLKLKQIDDVVYDVYHNNKDDNDDDEEQLNIEEENFLFDEESKEKNKLDLDNEEGIVKKSFVPDVDTYDDYLSMKEVDSEEDEEE